MSKTRIGTMEVHIPERWLPCLIEGATLEDPEQGEREAIKLFSRNFFDIHPIEGKDGYLGSSVCAPGVVEVIQPCVASYLY